MRTFLAFCLGLLLPLCASAQSVTTEAALRDALINAESGTTITLGANITLTADLPSIAADIVFDGAGHSLSGNGQFRGLVVAAFEEGWPSPVTVTIQDVTIADTVARGGNGGSGSLGGGGGAGLGGAIFVAGQSSVILANVSVVNSQAIGGNGGAGGLAGGSGGGGGMGGHGGNGTNNGTFDVHGGGGGAGTGANGGSNSAGGDGILTGTDLAGESTGGESQSGGALSGGGGSTDGGGAGGGVDGQWVSGMGPGSIGGFGGYGGGGGGAESGVDAGFGGFGGGGGGGGGFADGGYGGGGGGGTLNGAVHTGGFAGGDGGGEGGPGSGGGGGGAGLGGGIFVEEGGSLTILGNLTINGSQVSAGRGGDGAGSGSALGSGLFFGGDGSIVFAPDAGETQVIDDDIADEFGSLGFGGSTTLFKSGKGTLVLNGDNTYTGGTFVDGGTLRLASAASLGSGNLLLSDTTVDVAESSTFAQNMRLNGLVTFETAPGTDLTLSGSVTETICDCVPAVHSGLAVTGGGSLALTNSFNQFGGGVAVSGDSAVVVGSDAALGQLFGDITLGDATSGGTLAFVSGSSFLSSRFITLGAGGGTIDTRGTADITLDGLVTGSGGLTKTGAGRLTLMAPNLYTGGTRVAQGTLVAGDEEVLGLGGLQVDSGATFDLASFDQTVGSLSGGGAILLGDATLDVGYDDTSTTFSGSIGGDGALVKSGTGTLTLTGSNSYTGGTVVSDGTLAGNAASLQGDIQNDARVLFDQASAGTYGGIISGSGSLAKTGAGTLTLSGANSYAGGTTVSAGALQGDTSSLQGDIVNDATVIFNLAADGTYAGEMSGTGTLVKTGTATLTLTGANTQSGGTQIDAGTVVGAADSFGSAIVNNANLVFDQTTDATFTGTLAGAGTFTKTGSGALTLTGASSATGTTFITGGTLVGSTQSLRGTIVDDAILQFDQAGDGFFSGTVSGSGALVKNGAGTLVFGGANSYSGGTFVNAGTLAGTTASLQGLIVNNGSVRFDQVSDGTYAGSMSGTGSLFKSGAGTLTLSGLNSYSGGTLIAGGAIAIGADGSLGAANGSVTLGDALTNGTLSFMNSALLNSVRGFTLEAGGGIFNTTAAAVTLGGAIGGSGSLTKTGAGVLELAHTNSYTGGTVIAEGTLRAGAADAFGAGTTLLVNAGGTLDLNGFTQSVSTLSGSGNIALGSGSLTTGTGNVDSAFAGAIAGAGSLVKVGAGTLFLSGNNSYTGGTSVLGGALVGDTRSIQGDILNNGIVQLDMNDGGTYAGSMSGSGGLLKTGSGLLTLTGTNTYTGGTLIAGGSIEGTPTSLAGLIINNGSLTFGGSLGGNFGGSILGAGSLTKIGSGTMTVNGFQSFTGTATVAGGTMNLNGGIAGSVAVGSGATLRVNGLIGGSLTIDGSLFALPAESVSESPSRNAGLASGGPRLEDAPYLTVLHNLTGRDGSHFSFEVGPGDVPTMLVGGAAALNGVHFDVTAPQIGDQRSTSFLAIAAADGLSFVNSDITVNQEHVLPLLRQTPNALFVTLVNLNLPLGIDAVGEALDRGKLAATGDGLEVIKTLTALDPDALEDALQQLGGQLHASVLQTAVVDAESVTDLVRDQLSAREADAGNDIRWWGETMCQHASFKGSNRVRGGDANVCAGGGGADRRFSERWTIGAGGSFTNGNMGLGGLGNGDYSAPRGFGYAGFKPSRWGVRFGGSAAKSNYKTKRQIQIQARLPEELGSLPIGEPIDRVADASQQGTTTDQWSEIHDSRDVHGFRFEGLVGVRHARVSRSEFAEKGAQSLSLDGQDSLLNLTQTDVQAHMWRREGRYRPFFDLAYRRELAEDVTQADMNFTGVPESDFTIRGLGIPTRSYTLRGGMTLMMLLGQATFTYEYKAAEGERRQSFGFRMRFK